MTPKLNMTTGKYRQFRPSWLFASFAAGLLAGKFLGATDGVDSIEQVLSVVPASETPAQLQPVDLVPSDELTRSLRLVASRNSNFSQSSPYGAVFIHFSFDSHSVIDRLISTAYQVPSPASSRIP